VGKVKVAGNPNMVKGGPSVNPQGRPKGRFRPLTEALIMELIQDPKRARRIARRLLQQAEEGIPQAQSLVFDRVEGKAIQQIEMGQAGDFMDGNERVKRILELQDKALIENAVEVPLLPTRVK
jgi:hypothetical protein